MFFKTRKVKINGRSLPARASGIVTLRYISNMELKSNIAYLTSKHYGTRKGFINKTMKDIRWYSSK